MQVCKKSIATSLLTLTLTACSSLQPQHNLDPQAVTTINEVETFLVVDQDEIYADIKGSNMAAAAGGGLLFALIDMAVESSQTSHAESSIQPIRDHLIDYDYASVLQSHINREIAGVNKVDIKEASLERAVSADLFSQRHGSSEASAVLFLSATYNMTPDFSSVITTVEALMFPNTEALYSFKERKDGNESHVDPEDNIYHNTFTQSRVVSAQNDASKNIEELNTSPEKIKKALESNAKLIAESLRSDLEK